MTSTISSPCDHHISLIVPDVDQAVGFFTNLFGKLTILDRSPVRFDNAVVAKYVNVPNGETIIDHCVIESGRGDQLKLFEYPCAQSSPSSEIGVGTYIAFEVDDAFAVAERMKAAGIDLLEGPTRTVGGPVDELIWLCLCSPWGQHIEIISIDGPLECESEWWAGAWSTLKKS